MKPTSDTVEGYLNNLEPPQKVELERIRALIKKETPGAQESISYQMPAFKYKGKPLIYYGAFKDHMSIFPTSGPIAELEKDLEEFSTAKGTLKFTLDKPIPDEIIKKLVQTRIKQIEK